MSDPKRPTPTKPEPTQSKKPAQNALRVLAWPFCADRDQNPYASLLYGGLLDTGAAELTEFSLKRLFRGRWDIVHIHWPDGFWPRHALPVSAAFALVFLIGLMLARLRGARLVWTTHNLAAHEQRNEWARKIYMRGFIALCDGLISLSDQNRAAILEAYPGLSKIPGAVISHGLYDDHYPPCSETPGESRAHLDLAQDGKLLLVLGNIRPYKGYPLLIEAFRQLPEAIRSEWTLLIAGKSGDGHGQELREMAADLPGVLIREAFVPDAEIGRYMSAADFVILPYRQMQNSGAANLAVTFGCPVIAPDISSFRDMAQNYPGMVHLFEGEIDAARLGSALGDTTTGTVPDWRLLRHEITTDTLALYRRCRS